MDKFNDRIVNKMTVSFIRVKIYKKIVYSTFKYFVRTRKERSGLFLNLQTCIKIEYN